MTIESALQLYESESQNNPQLMIDYSMDSTAFVTIKEEHEGIYDAMATLYQVAFSHGMEYQRAKNKAQSTEGMYPPHTREASPTVKRRLTHKAKIPS